MLVGEVLTPAGNPLSDAIVSLLRGDDRSITGTQQLMLIREPVATDAVGKFRFDELLGGGGYAIRVEHGAYARQERLGLESRKGEVVRVPDFRLGSGATLSGFVTRKDSEVGIAGVVVAVRSLIGGGDDPTSQIVRQSISDKDGFFKLPNMAPGVYQILAQASGYATAQTAAIHVTAPNQELTVAVSMGAGFSIQGNVLLPGGEPAPDVAIEVAPTGNSRTPPVRVVSRKSGAFVADGLTEGKYRLRVSAPGYSCPDTTAETSEKGVSITLIPCPGVTGYVVGKDTGDPLKSFGLQVWAVNRHNQPTYQLGESMKTYRSEDGSFSIESLPAGRYMIKAFHNDYRPTWSPAFDLRRVYVHGLVIEMELGSSLRGTILDPRGNPYPNAKVSLLENTVRVSPLAGLLYGKESKLGSARSDEEGVFTFERLMPGTYQVRVEAPDLVTLYQRDIVVLDEQVNDAGNLQLANGGTIVVAVIDGRGVAATGANVEIRSSTGDVWNQVVNAEGEASFPHLLTGSYDVSVVHINPDKPGSFFEASVNGARNKQTVEVVDGIAAKVYFNVP